jgi:type III restriction enzyme
MKKRQEIGRGMRLCVNQEGDRIFDRRINLLSVIANISYADYVASLQAEFQEDGIYKSPALKPRQNLRLFLHRVERYPN